MFSPQVENPAGGPALWVISPLAAIRSAQLCAAAFRVLFEARGPIPWSARAMLTQVRTLFSHVAAGGAGAAGGAAAGGFGVGVGVGVEVGVEVGIADGDALGLATIGAAVFVAGCGATSTQTSATSTANPSAMLAMKMLRRRTITGSG
jgi:hypothetical protein